MWLRFVSEYCKGIEYVFKIDDDVVIDLYALLSTIYKRRKNSSYSNGLRTIFGYYLKETYVIRYKTSKWYTLKARKNANILKALADFFEKMVIYSLFQEIKIIFLNLKHFWLQVLEFTFQRLKNLYQTDKISCCRYVSRAEYPFETYGDYCGGFLYVIPGLLVPELFNASKRCLFSRVIVFVLLVHFTV